MSAILELEAIPCPLCGTPDATLLCAERDLALGVPWQFPLTRCERCGPLYQNPRVRRAQLERMYPADCPPHARGTAPARLALAALDSRLGGGLVKLVLEVALKAAGPARRGEVVRYFIRHRDPA